MISTEKKTSWFSIFLHSKLSFEILKTAAAILLALLIAVVIIFFTSEEPIQAIRIFLLAPFLTTYNFGQILTQSIPLIFTGVAVCIMVRGGQFNLFVEGAFFIGMLLGAVIAAKFKLPAVMLPLVAMLIPSLLAGAIGYIPAKMKAELRINEFVTSLMFNFIVFWVCMYLFTHYFYDPDYSSLATPTIPENGKLFFLSSVNEVSSSLLLALLVAGLSWFFLNRTKWGYAIRMTGENPDFAKFIGINVKVVTIWVQVLGAALAAFGGAAFELGNYYRFNLHALPNYGFDGFIIAIVARNNPLLVPFAALFLGYLRAGASQMALYSDVTNDVVYIIQAIMLILIGGQAFLAFLRERSVKKMAYQQELEQGQGGRTQSA